MLKKNGIILLGVIALIFCIVAISNYFLQEAHADTWTRIDPLCPDKTTEKTRCVEGGAEQCEAKYCNALPI